MKQSTTKLKSLSKLLVLIFLFISIAGNANSQSFKKIKNRWKSTYIHIENGLTVGGIQAGWHSAQWVFEPVAGTRYVKIKNRWKGTYLHNQNGRLECGRISPGWWSAQWLLETVPGTQFFKIKNRWKSTYIHNQNGRLECGRISPGWWSAQWKKEGVNGVANTTPRNKQYVHPSQRHKQNTIQNRTRQRTNNYGNNGRTGNSRVTNSTPSRSNVDLRIKIPGTNQSYNLNQLESELRKGGFTLVQTNQLGANQCAIVYPNVNRNDLSAEFGLLSCAVQIGDKVSLKSTAVYGGCDASNPATQGSGVKCGVGLGASDITVRHGGGSSRFSVKGPSASACSGLSTEMMCSGTKAHMASASFEVKDEAGNGIGIGVSAGVGAGLNGGYEDGIISASMNLTFIAGGSISISLNVQDVGKKVIKAGKTGYVLYKNGIIAASNEMIRAYNRGDLQNVTGQVVALHNSNIKYLKATFKELDQSMNTLFRGITGTRYLPTTTAPKGAYSYRVLLDCFHKQLSNEGTSNKIHISLYSGNRVIATQSKVPKCGAASNPVFTFQRVTQNVTKVRITTTGTDGFFLDKVTLKRSKSGDVKYFELYKRWGADGGRGYCLSKDPADANGGFRNHVSACYEYIDFYMNGNHSGVKGNQTTKTTSNTKAVNQSNLVYYIIGIDYNHPKIDHEGTTNTISACVVTASGRRICAHKVPNTVGNANVIYRIPRTGERITGIEIKTNGDNAFFIDQVTLRKSYKSGMPPTSCKIVKKWGGQAGTGWCLSTDSGDGASWPKFKSGSCRSKKYFGL